jgi:hypothetical protein
MVVVLGAMDILLQYHSMVVLLALVRQQITTMIKITEQVAEVVPQLVY